MTSHKEFKCMDCKKNTWDEYYMLYSRVWKKANPEIKDKLCIVCVEKRLRRNLTSKGFTKAMINTEKTKRTIKLQNRING